MLVYLSKTKEYTKMKKLLLLFCTLMSVNVSAQEFQIDLNLIGISIFGESFSSLRLDLGVTPRFVRANGVIVSAETGDSRPATGTCFATAAGGVICNVRVGSSTFDMDLDSALNGIVTIRDPNGSVLDNGSVRFSQIR